MTSHAPTPTARRSARIDRISDRIDELLEPKTIVQTQWVELDALGYPARLGYGPAVRLADQRRTVVHPSLLEQLARDAGGSTASTTRSGHESRPPANLDAASTLHTIRKQSRWWVRRALDAESGLLPDDLRLIARRAHELDLDDLPHLDRDVLGWWTHAQITTTWATPPLKPHVPCMACGRVGTLRVVIEPQQAAGCLSCRASWDATTIGILGEHVRLATAATFAERATRAAAARPAARAARAPDVDVLDPEDGVLDVALALGLPMSEHTDVEAWRQRVERRRGWS